MPNQPLRVQIVADFNAEVLARYLAYDETPPAVEAAAAAYGQVWQTLAAAADGERVADAALVWTTPEGAAAPFARLLEGHPVTPEEVMAEVDRFADALLAYRRRLRHLFVASWTLPAWRRGHGMLEWVPGTGARHLLARMNLRLAERLAGDGGSFLLDAERWLQTAEPYPPKSYFVSKVPFANAVLREAVAELKAALDGVAGRARKVVIVDLDDTLWGGIVGDVGWQGLRLGGHDPRGEAHAAFQRALLALTRRGVQLAIVSKNEEEIALEAIDRHPEMVLRREHFAGWRIDWRDKAQNVAELLRELELGADAAVFIDDNPAERARVREALPEVLVPEWPGDPARYVSALGALRCFDQPVLSAEDRARAASYAAERARRESRREIGSLDDWLATLELRVTRALLGPADLERTAQLLNKTNQMNLATRRLSAGELAEWAAAEGRELWTFRVADRFGDAGLTGILSTEIDGGVLRIVDFVLSCRVMGRKVEHAMAHCAVEAARARGLETVRADYRATERNRPCLAFWRGSGFTEEDEGRFFWPAREPFPLPDAVELVDAGAAP